MSTRRHKRDTKFFSEMSFQEQSRSIRAEILNVESAIRAHIRYSKEPNRIRRWVVKRLEKSAAQFR